MTSEFSLHPHALVLTKKKCWILYWLLGKCNKGSMSINLYKGVWYMNACLCVYVFRIKCLCLKKLNSPKAMHINKICRCKLNTFTYIYTHTNTLFTWICALKIILFLNTYTWSSNWTLTHTDESQNNKNKISGCSSNNGKLFLCFLVIQDSGQAYGNVREYMCV